MKLRIRDRLLSALMGLIICAASVWGFFYIWRITLTGWQRWAGIAACVVLFLIGLCGIAVLFRHRKDKGFVLQRTEYGDVSISMKALENMVKRCVAAHDELNVSHTRIYHDHGGVSVDVKITLPSGMNIPLTVNALQKQIKQYITSCSGIDVHAVCVKVETDIAKLPAPAEFPLVEETPQTVEEIAPEAPVAAEVLVEEAPVIEAEEISETVEEVVEEAIEAAEETAETDEAPAACEEANV